MKLRRGGNVFGTALCGPFLDAELLGSRLGPVGGLAGGEGIGVESEMKLFSEPLVRFAFCDLDRINSGELATGNLEATLLADDVVCF
jgi:hypothetical protein